MKYNYEEMEPDSKGEKEARYISAMTRIQDEKEAAQLGMTIEEYYRERDEMHDDSYLYQKEALENGIW